MELSLPVTTAFPSQAGVLLLTIRKAFVRNKIKNVRFEPLSKMENLNLPTKLI